jgi:hypothetical protein
MSVAAAKQLSTRVGAGQTEPTQRRNEMGSLNALKRLIRDQEHHQRFCKINIVVEWLPEKIRYVANRKAINDPLPWDKPLVLAPPKPSLVILSFIAAPLAISAIVISIIFNFGHSIADNSLRFVGVCGLGTAVTLFAYGAGIRGPNEFHRWFVVGSGAAWLTILGSASIGAATQLEPFSTVALIGSWASMWAMWRSVGYDFRTARLSVGLLSQVELGELMDAREDPLVRANQALSTVERRLESRRRLAERLEVDVERYQELLNLSKSEVEAIAQTLRHEVQRESRLSLGLSILVNVLFFGLGIAVTLLAKWEPARRFVAATKARNGSRRYRYVKQGFSLAEQLASHPPRPADCRERQGTVVLLRRLGDPLDISPSLTFATLGRS